MKDKFKIFLTLGIFIFVLYSFSNVSATDYFKWCYQETANQTVSCGILNANTSAGGSYSVSGDWVQVPQGSGKSTFDGSFSSYDSSDLSDVGNAYMFVTYIKPLHTVSSSVWQVKPTDISGGLTSNLSIPSPCWNQTNLQFEAISYGRMSPVTIGHEWYCWGGSTIGWQFMEGSVATSGTHYTDIYEEGVAWRVQVVPPEVSIISPLPQVYSYNNSINLTYTVASYADGVSCKYNIVNSSGAVIVPNTTLISCTQNTNFSIPRSGTYNLSIYANDTPYNQSSITSVNFIVSLEAPAIVLDYPGQDKWFNDLSDFSVKFTANDLNAMAFCDVYGNWTGSWTKNRTILNPNSGQQYSTSTGRLSNGNYMWNVLCNDTTTQSWAESNQTFRVDTIYPNVTISSPSGTITSRIFNINILATDNYNVSYCFYWVTLGASTIIANTQIPDCISQTGVVATDADYVIHVCINDTAQNNFCVTSPFTVDTSTPSNPGGGGGGSIVIVQGNGSLWTMETDANGGLYELVMVKGSSRVKTILFQNKGNKIINLALSCKGDLCDNIKLADMTIGLPTGLEIKTKSSFEIDIPSDLADGTYVSNIIATDQDGNEGLITVQTQVGGLGIISEFANKIISSKNISGIGVPYVIIFIFSWLVSSFLTYIIAFTKKDGGKAISTIIGFVVGLIVLFFV
jgi:hypothetical protein